MGESPITKKADIQTDMAENPPPSNGENNIMPGDGLFQAVLKSMRQGIICTDPDGTVIEINEFAEALFDKRRNEVLGKSIFQLHPLHLQEKLQSSWENFEAGSCEDMEISDNWTDGRWLQMHFSPLKDRRGAFQGVIANYIEQTETKRLEEKQRTLELKLIQEHKLSAIGILASGIAHNLNGPLSIIIGYMDLLYARNPRMEELPIVLAQGERMKDIISNMMIKSRYEQDTTKKSINLNSLLQNELKFLEANLEFKHHIDKQYEFIPNIPNIYGIYSDFSQCFLNIINNAIDAMYDSAVKTLRVTTSFDDDNICVIIKDTGYGLNPQDAHKLFNPFFSTKPPVGEGKPGQPTGTGLGLSSAYQLIKKYGGSINIDGALGKGAQFQVILPIAKNLAPEEETSYIEQLDQEALVDI